MAGNARLFTSRAMNFQNPACRCHQRAQRFCPVRDPETLKGGIEPLQLARTDTQADDLRSASVGPLAVSGVVHRVIDRLQADPVPGGEFRSRNALSPLFGDAQALGLGQSAAA